MFSKCCNLKTFFIPPAPRHFRRNFTNNSINKMTVDWRLIFTVVLILMENFSLGCGGVGVCRGRAWSLI